jgi:hypothetical protein
MFNLAPPYPRDVAITLLVGFLLLLVVGTQRKSTPVLVAAGFVLGMVGLDGAEAFFVGMGIALAWSAFPIGVGRPRVAAALLLPALGAYSLWFVPQVINYVRLDGYINLTVLGPVTLPPGAILVSWGLVTPLAVYGAIRWLPRARGKPGERTALVLLLISASWVIAATIIPALLGEAFLSVGRAHRYWPLLYLSLALYAALGVSDLFERAKAARRWVAAALVAVVLAVALPSPVVAGLAVSDYGRESESIQWALRGDRRALLNLISPTTGDRCVAAVPFELDEPTWAYTGYRLVLFRWPVLHPGNLARIRWAGIYEHIPGDEQRIEDNRTLVRGLTDLRSWRQVADRYGVDVVVTASDRVGEGIFRRLPHERSRDQPYSVIRLTDCGT